MTAPRCADDRATPAPGAWSVEIAPDLDSIETTWRSLQQTGLATLFQSFDLAAAWYRHVSPALGATPCPTIVRGRRGEVIAVMALEAARIGPVRKLRCLGGTHIALNVPLLAGAEAADRMAADASAILAAAGRAAKADIVVLRRLPATWAGVSNPYVLPGALASADRIYLTELPSNYDAYAQARFSKHAQAANKRKDKKLAELGVTTLTAGVDRDLAARLLDAFFEQKAAFFRFAGLADPFEPPEIRAFYRACFVDQASTENPPFRLTGMVVGDTPVAVQGAVVGGGRASSCFTSYDATHPAAKFSPGGSLYRAFIRTLCEEGVPVFDLGIGYEPYKAELCEREERLFEAVLPVTTLGTAALTAYRAEVVFRRTAKDDPRLRQWVEALRRGKLPGLARSASRRSGRGA